MKLKRLVKRVFDENVSLLLLARKIISNILKRKEESRKNERRRLVIRFLKIYRRACSYVSRVSSEDFNERRELFTRYDSFFHLIECLPRIVFRILRWFKIIYKSSLQLKHVFMGRKRRERVIDATEEKVAHFARYAKVIEFSLSNYFFNT